MINNQCDLNKCHLTMNKLWGREKTQYLMVAEIGKLRRMPRHFSRSINRELTLMWRSCSRLLRVRNNCWCCASASCSFLWRNSTLSPSSCTSWTSLKQVISFYGMAKTFAVLIKPDKFNVLTIYLKKTKSVAKCI